MMSHTVSRRLSGVMAMLLMMCSATAWAGAPTDFVKGKTQDVTKVLAQKESKARSKSLDKILKETVDFRELASRSLKGYWEKQTPEQQQEFLDLLQQLLEANYSNKLSGKTLGKDFTIEYQDEKVRGDVAVVKTRVVFGEESKPVSYKLVQRGEGVWIVFDIIIDDISLEETYRESYTEIIREEGWDSLIKRMRDKVKEIEVESKKR